VTRWGTGTISNSQGTAGPMARAVRDAAVLLGVLAGADPKDPATQAKGARFGVDYTAQLRREALRGARLGIPRTGYFGYSPATDAPMDEALRGPQGEGAGVVGPGPPVDAGEVGGAQVDGVPS